MSALSNSAGRPPAKILLLAWAVVILIAAIVLSPCLGMPPLYDETYMLAWVAHCLQSGPFSNDTTAYLTSGSADGRDGLNFAGALCQYLLAMFSGTNYSVMRFGQFLLHLGSAGLLAYCVSGILQEREEKVNTALANATGIVAAFFFLVFPLAPEAALWLGGYPVELATFAMMTATAAILGLPKGGGQRTLLLILAAATGLIAPWLSAKVAPLAFLPLAMVFLNHPTDQVKSKAPLAIAMAILVSALAATGLYLGKPLTLPEPITQLTVEKINLAGDSAGAQAQQNNSVLNNATALALPVNRKIDERYNKVLRRFYLALGLTVLTFVVAFALNSRFRLLALLALTLLAAGSFATNAVINAETFYGSRWLYPLLPLAGLLWALLALSPLYITVGNKLKWLTVIKVAVSVAFVLSFAYLLIDRTYKQCMSYKSNGKLWKVIDATIASTGRKHTNPYLILRNLPQTLSIAPLISPFSPQLIDTQSGMPRTMSLSGGKLKESLRRGQNAGVTMHYEKQYDGFIGTDLKITVQPFKTIDAKTIAAQLNPPIMYYQGTVTLDQPNNLLHLVSQTKMGPAVRLESYGLSPVDSDFLVVEARIKMDAGTAETKGGIPPMLELHWLTNWLGDWEARDRRVLTTGIMDGQFHRYYFPMRTLAWDTSGLPTNIMLGFPRGSTVDLKSVGVTSELPLPTVKAAALHKQDSNRNYFSHFCFDYPDVEELGISAVYGKDNALVLDFNTSAIAGALETMIEIVPGNEAFRNENAAEPLAAKTDSKVIFSETNRGTIKIPADNFGATGGIYSVRVFAADRDGKPLGQASDSLKILVDPRL